MRGSFAISASNGFRQLHMTQPRAALPPILITMAKPMARVMSVLLGKVARNWWRKLPSDRKVIFRDLAQKHRTKFGVACGVGVAGAWAAYDSHVLECPVTGRKRFVALTPDQMKKISRVEFQNLLDELGPDILTRNHEAYSLVARVANRLLAANRDLRQIYDKQWTVTVVDQDIKNAFVLPSGNIFVFRGMINLCENDDQLGIILGHEMAHAVLGHSAEKLTLASFLQVVLLLPFAVLWAVLPNDGVALVANWFMEKVLDVMVELPFSRGMEMEADEVGLELAAKACFDVREAPALWGKMELMSEDPLETDKDLEFISTHPVHSNRQQSLASQLGKALGIRQLYGCQRLDCTQDPNIKLEEFKKYLETRKKELNLPGSGNEYIKTP